MTRKRIQLALIHLAVAITLVPINSTLNRVMVKELAISTTVVALLASLPYLFSPLQVWIGDTSDRHPLFGRRRTPYIALGLVLCALGVIVAPVVVFWIPTQPVIGYLAALAAFFAWGMGFNLASVSYLSLASEISGQRGRTQTVSVMWFVMILGIILTAITLSRLLETYTPAILQRAFLSVGLFALLLGLLGLVGLEPRSTGPSLNAAPRRAGWLALLRGVLANPQARRFFLYLVILLAAILGQDVLLEPYAAEAFHLPVRATTRITSIWGGTMLLALVATGMLERRLGKRPLARFGGWFAVLGFVLIAGSGVWAGAGLFYAGVVVLGLATGVSTAANLSLMLDMTTSHVGLFIGAWGMADALARLLGTVMSGVVRDIAAALTANSVLGYSIVFLLQAGLLLGSLVLLRRIDPGQFQQQEADLSLSDRAALLNEAS